MISADLGNPYWLELAEINLNQYDVIYHLAYAIHSDEKYNYAVTVDSVRILIDGLSRISDGRKRHFVYAGSMVVFGVSSPQRAITENHPHNANSMYAQNKLAATRLAMSPPDGVISTVLHPTAVYAETSPRIAKYRKLLTYNYVPSVNNLGVNNIIYADDFALALLQCLDRPLDNVAEEYIINGESIQFYDWFSHLSSTVRKKSWVVLPAFTSYVCRGAIRRLLNSFHIGCPVYFQSARVTPLTQTSTFSSAKASRDFSFKAKTLFSEVCNRLAESADVS